MAGRPQRPLSHPLVGPLVAGALARGLAAYAGVGFYGRDDAARVLSLFQAIGNPHDPVWFLRSVAGALGLYGLSIIPLLYLAARRWFDAPTARLAAYLAALHAAMPYAATHAFGEGLAVPWLGLALLALSHAGGLATLVAGTALGVATALSPAYAILALGLAVGSAVHTRRLIRPLGLLALTLAVGAVGSGLVDTTPTAWAAQQGAHAAPMTSLLWWLVLSVPPATLWLVPGLWRSGRSLPTLGIALALYVVVQVLMLRPEPRLLIPALPVWIVLSASLPSAWRRRPPWLARLWPAAVGYTAVLLAGALLLLCTYEAQRGVRDSALALRDDAGARAIVSLGPPLDAYYLQGSSVPRRRRAFPDAGWLLETLAALRSEGIVANRFVAFAEDAPRVNLLFSLQGMRCDAPTRLESDWLDRWLLAHAPTPNRRRGAVLLWRCEPPALARADDAPYSRPSSAVWPRSSATCMR